MDVELNCLQFKNKVVFQVQYDEANGNGMYEQQCGVVLFVLYLAILEDTKVAELAKW